VFFNSNGSTTVPVFLDSMTRNIQKNGYSTSNPSSADYAITVSNTALSNVLMTNVISRINVPAVPIQMVINGVSSSTFTNGQFVYADTIRLGNTTVTKYTMQITYRYTNSSTGQTHDSTTSISFSVRKDSTATIPSGIALACTTLVPPIISTLSTAPAHNPVGPNNPIPSNSPTLNFYKDVLQAAGSSSPVTGALIGIQSKGAKLTQRTNGSPGKAPSYGDGVVYDAVGNLVAKGLHVYSANKISADSTYSYGIYWNCHNINDRLVGNGTYLLVISTTNVNNKVEVTRTKVGVSR
jgi:hypothetical protein